MPSSYPQDANDRLRAGALVETVLETTRCHLESEKQRIQEEIRNYPRPIPACDLQFNYLLQERASIARELDQLDEVSGEGPERGERVQLLREFIRSSRHLEAGARERLASSLLDELAERRD
jgi:hypothetical protein